MTKEFTGYELSRAWFDYAFEHTGVIKPVHTALYFYILDLWNRLGKKERFGLPASLAMETLNILNKNTYCNTVNDISSFGFIKIIQLSKNQSTATVIAISKINTAKYKANDKALYMAIGYSEVYSTDTIDKPNNLKPLIKGKEKSLPDDVIEYFNISDFQKKINEWVVYRKQIKKPLQQMTKDRLPEEILKMANGDEKNAIEIINRSITNGWQGLFKLTDNRIPASNFERLNNM